MLDHISSVAKLAIKKKGKCIFVKRKDKALLQHCLQGHRVLLVLFSNFYVVVQLAFVRIR